MTSKRPRSWLRRRWWLLLIVLVGVPALLARIALDPSSIEALLKQVALDNYALDLQVDDTVSLQVFPRPRLTLHQARFADTNGRKLATLKRLEVDLPWRSLWTTPPPLGRIWMSDVDIHAGPALDDWLALFNTGPPSPTLHWPVLADGFSARRVRYLAEPAVLASDELDDAVQAERDLLIVALDLEPLYLDARLELDLELQTDGYRLALRLNGRADERDGALRIAGGQIELAFGPQGEDDEALQSEGDLDLSLLSAGAFRGAATLRIQDPQWLATRSGLALAAPIEVQAELLGEVDYETDIVATINSTELALQGRWPLGGDAGAREAYLRGDYLGKDGLKLEGLELQRQPPKPSP